MPLRRAAAIVAALALAGCGRQAGRSHPAAVVHPGRAGASPALQHAAPRTILLVSGRDDHGLRQRGRVGLLRAPAFGARRRATVPDGALVRIRQVNGQWFRVQAVQAPRAQGWVNDHDLRGEVHVIVPGSCAAMLSPRPGAPGRPVAPNVQAEMIGALRRGRRDWIEVRTIRSGTEGWAPSSYLHELPAHRCQP